MHGGQWTPFTHMSMTNGNYASPAHLDSNDVGMGYVLFYLRCKHSKPSLYWVTFLADDVSLDWPAATHFACHVLLLCFVSLSPSVWHTIVCLYPVHRPFAVRVWYCEETIATCR